MKKESIDIEINKKLSKINRRRGSLQERIMTIMSNKTNNAKLFEEFQKVNAKRSKKDKREEYQKNN